MKDVNENNSGKLFLYRTKTISLQNYFCTEKNKTSSNTILTENNQTVREDKTILSNF